MCDVRPGRGRDTETNCDFENSDVGPHYSDLPHFLMAVEARHPIGFATAPPRTLSLQESLAAVLSHCSLCVQLLSVPR